MSRKRFQLMREQKAERTKQQLDVHSKKYGEYQRQHKVNAGERKYLPALDGKKKRENMPIGYPRNIIFIPVKG